MRCRGVVVSRRLGQAGSQKPHSTQVVASSWIGGTDLRLCRWASGSRFSTTPGASTPSGSASAFTRHISSVAFSPHSRSTKGAMFMPVPCSAFSEPSYSSTIRSTRSRHERLVALAVRLLGELRREHEMQVSGRRMTGHAGQEAVLLEQRLDVARGLRHPIGSHADVLDDQRGARRAQAADQAVHPLADRPRELDPLVVACPVLVADQGVALEDLRRLRLERVEAGVVVRAELHEQRRRLRRQLAPLLRRPGHRVAGHDQRRRHHQLDRSCPRRHEIGDRRERRLEALEVEPGDRGARGHRHGLEHGLGDEGERALRSNQQAAEDLHGLVRVEERAQAVAGRVLDAELRADSLAQLGVGADLVADLRQACGQLGLGGGEALGRVGAALSITVPDGSTKVSARTVE